MCDSEASAQAFDGDQAMDVTNVSNREVTALLSNMPSAHGAQAPQPVTESSGLGYRLRVWKRRLNDPAKRARRAARVTRQIRFVYFAHADDDSLFGEYHHELVTAEVLLDRVLAARAAGMKSVHPFLWGDAEERLFQRPPRGSFNHITPEYIRWYGRDGVRRDVPMVREELAIELMGEYAYSYVDAVDIATRHSGALGRNDQAWLSMRSKAPITCRPLHATEFRQLVKAIEVAYDVPQGDTTVTQANKEIARRAAALLGALLDEYVETPFVTPELAEAFADFHSAHLQRIAAATRFKGLLPMPVTGVLSWFSAKRARIYAEVQARLAVR
ncbi:hypothetical protein [Dyella caseinilytica]|uniref:Uncharacterized protein n=1 Tax=Dyella caseinilytica TaxID=1849581 RepID=A0ABX7GRA5_9GAMM|nr:hypothetical protein [Dyella caseinilytica]QRN52347.1 hypothetical protein ISN74_12725 [Dyella caseinilytica]GGA14980.1 hypothetical protein GCM10011408_41170 [Dyella caseinilytica]